MSAMVSRAAKAFVDSGAWVVGELVCRRGGGGGQFRSYATVRRAFNARGGSAASAAEVDSTQISELLLPSISNLQNSVSAETTLAVDAECEAANGAGTISERICSS